MPEGDSVYRLAERLRRASDGAVIVAGELRSGNAAGASLAGLRIEEYATHGKHLLMRLSDATTVHTHLRMQGSWSITGRGKALPRAVQPSVRVRLQLTSGVTLWGIDLPVVERVPTASESDVIGHLGPDPLRSDWDAEEAVRRLAEDPTRPLVAALLDQRNMAGLGNLWVNEVAFLRGIHPFRPIGEVDLDPLVGTAARALRLSATTPGLYQVTTGRSGKGSSHWVVGRAGRPCLRCGTVIRVRAERPLDPEQRRTWWCPSCQPEGR
ncbi:DNA-formamidopyrimidine glycosylase family protein [Microbacterium sp. P01]|uniref:DNA-formamidopyrimidine glycosylase family protein n=1 Tax=unclassified Microbacterium TaxID=2609290 RepID=UPI003671BEB8